MSTAYVIFHRGAADAGPEIFRVVWREDDAIRLVTRLNALGPVSSDSDPYSWQPVWVDRRATDEPVVLTPRDREYLELAQQHEVLNTERPIGVFFTFLFDLPAHSLPVTSSARSDGRMSGPTRSSPTMSAGMCTRMSEGSS